MAIFLKAAFAKDSKTASLVTSSAVKIESTI